MSPVAATPERGGAPLRLAAGLVLTLGIVYVAVIVPPVAGLYAGDDLLLFVPTRLEVVQGRSYVDVGWLLVSPGNLWLPRAAWKLYVLGSVWVFGPSNAAQVYVGIVLHGVTSVLVWAAARRIGLRPGGAWIAAGMHLTAYPGAHAYLWPAGVQHVLTSLGIVATVTLYLATEQRRRAGQAYRPWYLATLLIAIASSLSRTMSLAAIPALLVHGLFSGSPERRRQHLNVWLPVVMAAVVYPMALLVFGGDREPYRSFPLLAALLGPLFALKPLVLVALLAATVLSGLLLLRMVAGSRIPGARTVFRPGWPRWIAGLAAVTVTGPILVPAALFIQGTTMVLLAPLQAALNTNNVTRSQLTLLPLEMLGFVTAAALVVIFVRAHRPPESAAVLVLLGGVAAVLYATGHYPSGHRPGRYGIYATPWLAILAAGALDHVIGRASWRSARPTLLPAATLVITGLAVFLPNILAIRFEELRHKVVDTFQVLDYIRVADLIRADQARLGRPAVPICVDGLAPPPHDDHWRWYTEYPRSFRDYNARAVLAQALGRRDASTIQLDCGKRGPPTATYVVRGRDVLRAGASVDSFVLVYAQLRDLVRARDYREARRLLDAHRTERPFLVRYMLERLPDTDLPWLTNGVSVSIWLDRIAATYDNWYGQANPKVAALRALARDEFEDYVRYRFLAWFLDSASPAQAPFTFGGLSMVQLEAIIRADQGIAEHPEIATALETNAHAPAPLSFLMNLGAPLTVTSVEFWTVLGRLVLGWPAHAADA